MAFAETTTVPVERSVAEIVSMVKAAGAERVAQYEEPDGFKIQFQIADRLIRFSVSFPSTDDMPSRDGRGRSLLRSQREARRDQVRRQRARALKLVIKAKLESIESGVETFEQAFLANVVLSDGVTLYERVREPIALEYSTGAPSALLLTDGGNRG